MEETPRGKRWAARINRHQHICENNHVGDDDDGEGGHDDDDHHDYADDPKTGLNFKILLLESPCSSNV